MVQDLLTPQSLAMSLAPPRAPPIGSAHRNLLCNKDPRQAFLTHHHEMEQNIHQHTRKQSQRAKVQCHHGLNFRIRRLLQELYHWNSENNIIRIPPHPHIAVGPDSGDQFTRFIGSKLPLGWQHECRDNGTFRSISDFIVTASVPSLALIHRHDARRFVRLTKEKITLPYGKHSSQYVDMFLPLSGIQNSSGFVFFVHGGAWGSGMPWMYRLCASPFLDDNLVVAIVGYRTYPDGNVQEQVNDLEAALKVIVSKYPQLKTKSQRHTSCSSKENEWRGTTIIGHSSGAHISLLMLVQRIAKFSDNPFMSSENDMHHLHFDKFIGLSGVYSISHHFDYEAGRGVEELSPMKPACGYTRESFDHYSPAIYLKRLLSKTNMARHHAMHHPSRKFVDEIISTYMPDILLLHGVEDSTVPFTSTSEAAKILRSCGVVNCQEQYLVCGHPDVVLELMLGGQTRTVVMNWLKEDIIIRLAPAMMDKITSKL